MIRSFLDALPTFDESVFIAESAEVIGDVRMGSNTSVWCNVSIRGDVNWVRIGASTNVQDNAVIHVSTATAPADIGSFVTIGHGAIVHGCSVKDRVLIGMGAIILDNAVVNSDCIIGAGALITQRMEIPSRSLVLGSPASVVRPLTEDEYGSIRHHAESYVRLSRIYMGLEKPESNPFYDTLKPH